MCVRGCGGRGEGGSRMGRVNSSQKIAVRKYVEVHEYIAFLNDESFANTVDLVSRNKTRYLFRIGIVFVCFQEISIPVRVKQ